MRLERDADGRVTLHELSPFYVDTLSQIPAWLGSEDPRVRERLFPDTYQADEREEEWRRLVGPELEHLFASRSEVLQRDLATLEPDSAVTFRMSIAHGHQHAWLSALNGARHALFALHELHDGDLERDPADLGDPERELGLVRIHVMAFVQEMLLQLD